ncbi:MAG: hypothetical protein NEHIOOID_00092 [Holosporales bacterium]
MKKQFFPSFFAALFLMNALHASAPDLTSVPDLNRVIDQLLRFSGLSGIDQTESQFYESLKIDENTFLQTVAPQIASQAVENKTAKSCQELMALTAFKSDDSVRLDHANKALSIARELKNNDLICNILLRIAGIPGQGQLIRAQKALSFATELNDQRRQFDALIILACIPHEEDLGYAKQALDVATALNNQRLIFDALYILTRNYRHENPIRLEYAQKALDIARALNDEKLIFDALFAIARNPHEGNVEYAQEALSLAKKFNDQRLICRALLAIARITSQEDSIRLDSARKALDIAKELQDDSLRFDALLVNARIPHEGDLDLANEAVILAKSFKIRSKLTAANKVASNIILARNGKSKGVDPCPSTQQEASVLPTPQQGQQNVMQQSFFDAAQMWTYPSSFFPPQQ